jgi:hypothetical protein
VFIRPTSDNAERLLDAVQTFGFPTADLRAEQIVDGRRILQMGEEPLQIHVMSAISGVSWDDAWRDHVTGACGRRVVAFLGRDSFLRNKRAAARPKDLADIDALNPGTD